MTQTLPNPNSEPPRLPQDVARRIQYLQGYRDPQADSYAKAICSEWGIQWIK